MKDKKAVIKATAELREKNKVVEVPKPTQEELLTQILAELKKQNSQNEFAHTEEITQKINNNEIVEEEIN